MPSITQASRPSLIVFFAVVVAVAAAISVAFLGARGSHAGSISVTNTDDSGTGSLRETIIDANGNAGPDTIHFNIPGCPADCTINVTSTALPNISGDDTTIDGTTQDGYVGTPLVILDGSALGSGSGLSVSGSDGSVIRGLAIENFPGDGVFVGGAGVTVEENSMTKNGRHGISVQTAGVTIANNLITDNDATGIATNFGGSPDITIVSNTISNNGGSGINASGDGIIVSMNTVSGNGSDGISASYDGDGKIISENIVTGNGRRGITSSTDGDSIIDNVVSGNGWTGIEVEGNDTVVRGNEATGNGVTGTDRDRRSGMTLGFGRDVVVTDNLVSENMGDGLYLGEASDIRIGGTSPGDANTITDNGGAGVFVADVQGGSAQPAGEFDFDSVGNTISGNEISGNGGLGIDLAPEGVTANDPGDNDGGANRGQNFPVLTEATAGSLTVKGTLDSRPEVEMQIEFFANDECDPSGNGEGQEFIGFTTVMTDLEGMATFSVELGADVPPGKLITSTATNMATRDTSEFSACTEVVGEATGTPTATPPGQTPTPTATPTPTPTAAPVVLAQGDNDCDGDTDSVDALKELQNAAALPFGQEPGCPDIGGAVPAAQPAGEPPDIFGDVDCDGDADAVDALKVLQFVAALPFSRNEPCPDIGEAF